MGGQQGKEWFLSLDFYGGGGELEVCSTVYTKKLLENIGLLLTGPEG